MYLFFVKVCCYANSTLYEDGYCKKTTIKKNHLVTFSGYSTTPKHGDEDDDRAGDDDDAPRDMIHAGGEEAEELAPVNDGPQSYTETREAEHQEEDVVAVQAELETWQRTLNG